MNQDSLKQAVARAALEYVLPRLGQDSVLGIGTGSTVNHFIDAVAAHRHLFAGCVSSSEASSEKLRRHQIEILDLNSTGTFDI